MILKPIVIWGASSQARILAAFLEPCGYRLVAIFDRNPAAQSLFPHVPQYSGEEEFLRWRAEFKGEVSGAVAIGGDLGAERLKKLALFERHGVMPATLIHPSAIVDADAVIGPGSQVLAQALIAPGAVLGAGCIINHGANVDHETRLADGVHVSGRAAVGGMVDIGTNALIGVGSIVMSRLRVGAYATVGVGAVVLRDVPEGALVLGNPARVVPRGSTAPRLRQTEEPAQLGCS